MRLYMGFSSICKKPHAIWRARTPQQALGRCQPDHPKLPRKYMNNG